MKNMWIDTREWKSVEKESLEKSIMSKAEMWESVLLPSISSKIIALNKSLINLFRARQRDQKQKVLCEIQLLKKISHPQIVKFIEAFESFNEIIIITEFLNGGELFDR